MVIVRTGRIDMGGGKTATFHDEFADIPDPFMFGFLVGYVNGCEKIDLAIYRHIEACVAKMRRPSRVSRVRDVAGSTTVRSK